MSAIVRWLVTPAILLMLSAMVPIGNPGVSPTMSAPGEGDGALNSQTAIVVLTPCAINLQFDYSDSTGCDMLNYVEFKL